MKQETITAVTDAEVTEIGGEAAESAKPCAEEEAQEVVPFWQGADTADKLSYAAALYGVPEEMLIDGLLRQSGDSGAGWQQHLTTRRQKDEEATTTRLAAEFDELCAHVPEFRQVQDVPSSVVETASAEGITLLDAYLRQWYAIARQTAAEVAKEGEAAAQSAGSLGGVFEELDPKETAFSRAFRMALS